jgi:hypothetical protein
MTDIPINTKDYAHGFGKPAEGYAEAANRQRESYVCPFLSFASIWISAAHFRFTPDKRTFSAFP